MSNLLCSKPIETGLPRLENTLYYVVVKSCQPKNTGLGEENNLTGKSQPKDEKNNNVHSSYSITI